MLAARTTLVPCVITTGRCERTCSTLRKACRNSPRNSIASSLSLAGRLTRASPSSCTSLPSPLASARRAVARVTLPLSPIGADPRRVDLEGVVVGIVAQGVALDLGAQRAVGGEALDHETGHHVVGLVARRRGGARRLEGRGIAHQPPGAGSEHRHHHQRQVGRREVEQAQVPGRGRHHRLGAGEGQVDRVVVLEARRPGPRRQRAPSSERKGPCSRLA